MGQLSNYTDFVLQLSKEAPHLYRASAIVNDSVAAAQTFELRTDELKIIESLRRIEEQAVRAQGKETFHTEFGSELYTKVFGGELGKYFKKCLEEAEKCGAGLRISLRFDENAQEIAALPWEFFYDSDFLSTNRKTLISRLPVGVNRILSSPLESMLRMLVVVSSPNDQTITPLNTELEQEVILEAVDTLQREHRMDVDFTEDATFETIESYLNEKEYHIVHFTGHGKYDKEEGKGYLILETEDGRARAVKNSAIADLLAGRSVRLVVLNACQSGKVSNKEAYADLASILSKKNVPAVVAMQYSILDLSATKFASVFYHAIASGKPVDLALTEARIVMKNSEESNGIDFATPVLYLSDPDCIAVGEIKPEASTLFNKPMMLGEVQMVKKGFVGRRKELRILQKDFMSDVKRAAVIYGFGGIGKTVLATRLSLKMSQYFDGIFGMRCTSTTRPEDILNKLNAFLNLAGVQELNLMLYQPVPLEVKTAALVTILNQKRFLIIFDNFEDCLDEARTNIASPELKEFIQHLLNNTITNTKFIITTRYNFDPLEGRLTGGIGHISLPELPFPETVWLMNNYKELANLDMKKKQEIYKAIGGHPWAIGQFAMHAAIETVDGLLLELAPLKHELINFTLLDKSYSRLDDKAKALLLRASVYQDAVPVEALSWIMGDENQPSPSVSEALSILINWGFIAKEQEREENLYAMHTLVREFAVQEQKRENLDRKQLLIRAAQYYENLVKTTGNLWDHLKAREYYYRAGEWEKAHSIVVNTWEYLERWGHIELAINLLNQSIKTTSGTRKTVALGNLATIYYGLGDPKTALKLYAEVKEIFEKEGDKKNVAASLHNLGMIHQGQGRYDEAVKKYEESMKIETELGDKGGIAYTLGQIGQIYQNQGKYEEAIERYQQVKHLSEELGDKSGIAKSLNLLGTIHYLQGNYVEAIKYYQQSLKIAEELGDKKEIAGSLHNLGIIHQDQGNYEEAVELYQKSLGIREELGDKKEIAGSLHNLGIIHQDQGNYEEAVELYQKSLGIREELGDKSGIAESLHQLGTIHYRQGNYKEAVKLYQQGLKIKEELGDKSGIAGSLHNLGAIHQDQGNYEEAVKLYQQSLKIKEELGDKSGIAGSLNQLGTIHYLQGNYKEAVKHYQQSLKIKEELGDKSGIANTLHNLGAIHQDQGNYEEAVKLYQQSLKIKEELGDKSGIANTLHNLGKIHQGQGNYEEAVKHYQQSLMIFKQLNDPNSKIVESSIARLREKMGKEAFKTVLKNLRRRLDA